MFRKQEEENLYFSTKMELKINNVIYRPSICYKVPPFSKTKLKELEAAGKVIIYPNKVRFVNGAVVQAEKNTQAVASVVRPEETEKHSKRKSR